MKLAPYFEIYSACNYIYDFGDHWDHEVKLKKVVLDSAKFKRKILDGKRAFPLDDCGGVPGYFDCADLITGVTKGNKELKEWIGKCTGAYLSEQGRVLIRKFRRTINEISADLGRTIFEIRQISAQAI